MNRPVRLGPERVRLLAVVASSLCAAAAMLAMPSDSAWQAPMRIGGAFWVTTVLPGYLVMRAFGWFAGAVSFAERLLLAFGVGYGLLTALCAIAVVAELSIAQAFALLGVATVACAMVPALNAGSAATGWTRPAWPLIGALVFMAVSGYLLQAPITGEETVELISIRKILQNPVISLDGIMPEPRVVPTYVVTPYYFFVALLAKVGGTSLFVAYLKMRAVYACLALLVIVALATRLLPAQASRLGVAVALGFLVLFVADPDPWSWPASFVPLVRRGGVAAGVLAPVFMLALLVYVTPPAAAPRAMGEWIAPGLMLLSLITTHAMEIIYVGFFAVGVVAAWALTRSPAIRWRRLITFGASCAVVALGYRVVHARFAQHVYAFDEGPRTQAMAALQQELAQGVSSLAGISAAGQYLISTSGAVIPYMILGILLTPVLIAVAPVGGAILWAAAIIPLAVYSSSKLFVLLQLATSTEILFVFSYFTLLGTVSFLACAYLAAAAVSSRWPGLASRPLAVAALTVAGAVVGHQVLAVVFRGATTAIVAYPLALPWVAGLLGLTVVLRRRRGGAPPIGPALAIPGLVVLVATLAGVAFGLRGFPSQIDSRREPLPQTMARARALPAVTDWDAYYPLLQKSANPPIDLPAAIVADLERLLPPLQTLAADPAHSFSLPVVLNQHIVNPGHVISTSLGYFEKYATAGADGVRRHPLFNDTELLSDPERQFLAEYGVQFILVNPPFEARLRRKLGADPAAFELVYERDGFLLYRCLNPTSQG